MKRDMDLVRKILLELEKHEHGCAPQPLAIKGHSEEEIGFHLYLMGQAELLRVADPATREDRSPCAVALNITWAGYEFLGAAREPSTWEKAKSKIVSAGVGVTFQVLQAVLVALGKQALGLP
jgi:hypothetical protein